jgi:hypothetical protein
MMAAPVVVLAVRAIAGGNAGRGRVIEGQHR